MRAFALSCVCDACLVSGAKFEPVGLAHWSSYVIEICVAPKEVREEAEAEDEDEDEDEENNPDVQFEASIMAAQRILDDDDEVVDFGRHRSRTGARQKVEDPVAGVLPVDLVGAAAENGWQVQNFNRLKGIKYEIKRELRCLDMMDEEEAKKVREAIISAVELDN